MKCVICKLGETHPGHVTVALQGGDTAVVLKGVPADVCDNCGEYYLSEEVTRLVLARAEEAVKREAEVEILRFAAWPGGSPPRFRRPPSPSSARVVGLRVSG